LFAPTTGAYGLIVDLYPRTLGKALEHRVVDRSRERSPCPVNARSRLPATAALATTTARCEDEERQGQKARYR